MSQDHLSILHRRGRRRPAACEPRFQQFIGRRPMIPDGDRRHHAESRGVVNEPEPAGIGNEDVVAEFVLRDHSGGCKRRLVSAQPIDGVLHGAVARHGPGEPGEILRSKIGAVLDRERCFQVRHHFVRLKPHVVQTNPTTSAKHLPVSNCLERPPNVLDFWITPALGPHDGHHIEARSAAQASCGCVESGAPPG